jgi:hypothetical protein
MNDDPSASSDLQSRIYAAMEECRRAGQKKREAAQLLQTGQEAHDAACRRGRPPQIKRARAALDAAQAAFDAAERDVKRIDDQAEEIIQAQLRAAYT